MQMMTLLPKVTHFFDLTADWASLSFAKAQSQATGPAVQTQARNAAAVDDLAHDSTASEKEDEVLSFVPRRRGSRADSPVSSAARDSLKREQQSRNAPSSGTSSSSNSDMNVDANTAATSTASLPATKARRTSPSNASTKSGPVLRVLQDEVDTISSPRTRRASDVAKGDKAGEPTPRRASDLAANAVAASAFVQAHDLLKRRREDAVADLGSSAVASSESE